MMEKTFRLVLSLLLIVGAVFLFVPVVQGDEIVHKFKNPSFSGIGTGAHYVTIENQEHARK